MLGCLNGDLIGKVRLYFDKLARQIDSSYRAVANKAYMLNGYQTVGLNGHSAIKRTLQSYSGLHVQNSTDLFDFERGMTILQQNIPIITCWQRTDPDKGILGHAVTYYGYYANSYSGVVRDKFYNAMDSNLGATNVDDNNQLLYSADSRVYTTCLSYAYINTPAPW